MFGRVALFVVASACGRIGFDPETANVVFVTSTSAPPATYGPSFAGGDAVCATRAAAVGLSGTYVAWLSSSTTNARTRLGSARGWVRVDGYPVLDSPDDIAALKMLAPIDRDESGAIVTTLTGTGTNADGTPSLNCNDYTNAQANIDLGTTSATTSSWTRSNSSQGCGTAVPLFCFGVDHSARLVVAPPPADARRAFLTTGNFAAGGGLAMADALCANEAQAAGLPGTFLALLGTTSASALSRFSLNGGAWYRVDDVPLGASPQVFVNNALDVPLNVTTSRAYINSYVLTGGLPNATPANGMHTCADWTNPTGFADVGGSDSITSAFTAATISGPCGGAPIYCLQT